MQCFIPNLFDNRIDIFTITCIKEPKNLCFLLMLVLMLRVPSLQCKSVSLYILD